MGILEPFSMRFFLQDLLYDPLWSNPLDTTNPTFVLYPLKGLSQDSAQGILF